MSRPACDVWENRLAILSGLEARGVQFRFDPDTLTLQYRAAKGVLTEQEEAGLDICRKGLTEALRLREGLCIACGLDAAKRPDRNGRKRVWNPETDQAEHVPARPSEEFCRRYPALWCDACFEGGAWHRGLRRETNAHSNRQASKTEKELHPAPETLF